MDYDQIGTFLEHEGLSDEQIDEYFEHHGVKGQKWGVRRAALRSAKGPNRFGNRNNPQVQRKIDRVHRVAKGKGSTGDMIKAGLFDVPLVDIVAELSLSGGAQRSLERVKRHQDKVKAGKNNIADMLNRLGGVDVRELKVKV